ncbi:hypothetical protein [Streptococcus cristatus]|uniref:Uncharacterized protein n=1 Tax=Streptococcus cristatus TaxID=45634 RepID=A0A139N4D8_STRCR|nr:hypothetical protein [Streptococcus cristatus]KXT70898.1 hypothetical protein SCRDD08_00332 [Streptococcus cristatus]
MGFAVYINEIIDNPKLTFVPFQTEGDKRFYLIWPERQDQTATEKTSLDEIEAQVYEIEN